MLSANTSYRSVLPPPRDFFFTSSIKASLASGELFSGIKNEPRQTLELPPRWFSEALSIIKTLAPSSTAWSAATVPAIPEPITRMSQEIFSSGSPVLQAKAGAAERPIAERANEIFNVSRREIIVLIHIKKETAQTIFVPAVSLES